MDNFRWNSYRVRPKRVSPFLSGYSQTLWILYFQSNHAHPGLLLDTWSDTCVCCLLSPVAFWFLISSLGDWWITIYSEHLEHINQNQPSNNYNKSLRLRDRFLPLAFTAATLSCFKAEGPAGCGIATCHIPWFANLLNTPVLFALRQVLAGWERTRVKWFNVNYIQRRVLGWAFLRNPPWDACRTQWKLCLQLHGKPISCTREPLPMHWAANLGAKDKLVPNPTLINTLSPCTVSNAACRCLK